MTLPGPLMIFLQGCALSAEERALLRRPAVGGVILFSRNYKDKAQLSRLVSEIRETAPELMLGVDHEGGRVQRFRAGFTELPPMRAFGELFERDPQRALDLLYANGRLAAEELREFGLSTAFSPVLDLFGSGETSSEVIGDRALHPDPEIVVRLAREFIHGLSDGGLLAVGKHFPGHGSVAGDTHAAAVCDDRPRARIEASDLRVFRELIEDGGLPAVMAAHVAYPRVDAAPASLSKVWLRGILREELGFDGIVFGDDLAMHGAGGASAKAMLEAGCDMVLICRKRELVKRAVDELSDLEVEACAQALNQRRRAAARRQAAREKPRERRWDAAAAREELAALTHGTPRRRTAEIINSPNR